MSKTINANMAGTVIEVLVSVGDDVKEGDDVAMLESMKMQMPIPADRGGKVKAIKAHAGDFVNEGDPLLELD